MGFANIFIAFPCSISVKNRQLVVRGEEERKLAIEDINSVMIESHESTVTTYALQALASADVAVFVCDRTHMPCGVMIPYKGHFRQPAALKSQLDAPKPLQKRMWQSIVVRKIENQAQCVEKCIGRSGGSSGFAGRVMSGDSGNIEAVAAALHFRTLFGAGFSRRNDASQVNAMLNYAYAIVRGLIARTLAVYGFDPSIGIHHDNMMNAFNLADDLIEPFRPIVDRAVFELVTNGCNALVTESKKALFSLTAADVEMDGQLHALSYAVDLVVQSFARSLKERTNLLILPRLADDPARPHRYE